MILGRVVPFNVIQNTVYHIDIVFWIVSVFFVSDGLVVRYGPEVIQRKKTLTFNSAKSLILSYCLIYSILTRPCTHLRCYCENELLSGIAPVFVVTCQQLLNYYDSRIL